MKTIPRSIIYYRPGSAGDFLKALCLGQLHGHALTLTDQGKTQISNDFKTRAFPMLPWWVDKDTLPHEPIVQEVENTGHVDRDLLQLWSSSKWFYIGVPDNLMHVTMRAALIKCNLLTLDDARSQGDQDLVRMEQTYGEIATTADMISLFTIEHVQSYNRFYESELPGSMERIEFLDIFDEVKCHTIIARLLQEQLRDLDRFHKQYNQWRQGNEWFWQMIQAAPTDAEDITALLTKINFVTHGGVNI